MHDRPEPGQGAAAPDSLPRYAPAGAWADLPAFQPVCPPTPDQVADGRRVWLSDAQFDLSGRELVRLARSVVEVVNADGLQGAAQVSVDFDPTYERVVFHHVHVIRDGRVRVFDPRRVFQVFQRERDLERAKYDGHLTAHFVIPDIRVGDIVDVAHSVFGQHPVIGTRFFGDWGFNWGCWVGETRVRVVAPAARRFATRSWNNAPVVVERSLPGGLTERIWRSIDTAPIRLEPNTASWVRVRAGVQFGDVITWPQVADMFRSLYATPDRLPGDLEARVAEIAAASRDPAVRTTRALRLVQESLRYQSVSVGAGGFTPNPVSAIWASRSGDCKDSSLLLTAILRRLEIDAAPALVHTWAGQGRAEELPSPVSSDHCIVRVRTGGKTYWLDPTRFPQGGRLDVVHQARFGWALPLVEGADIEFMGDDPVEVVVDCQERFVFGPRPDSPASLTVRTTYGAWRADDIRRQLASGRAALAEQFREFYARRFGGATAQGDIEVEDDLDANRLTTVERYEVARPWAAVPETDKVEFFTPDDLVGPHLNLQRLENRRLPADLGLPRRARYETILEMGRPTRVTGWDKTLSMPGLTMTSRHDEAAADGRAVRLWRELTVERRDLPPDQAAAFFTLRDEAARYASLVVTRAIRFGEFVDNQAAAPSDPTPGRKPRAQARADRVMNGYRVIWALVVVGMALSQCARMM